MIRNYTISFIRFLRKHKAYSINNIIGLSIGMASAVLIYLWILDELSFDKFHENYYNISRIVSTWDNADGDISITATAAPLAPKFEESFPEILESARFSPAESDKLISYGENKYYESDVAFADKEFFRIFTHPFIRGSSDNPYPTVNSAVITEKIAQKYFGEEDPVGKMITLDEEILITIGGVIENVPANSHLHFDILFNFELMPSLGWNLHWENNSIFAYVLMSDNFDYPSLKTRIDTLTRELYSHGTYEFHLQPLSDVHLRSSFDIDIYGHTEPTYQYISIFALIGTFILLISVINYINLSTALSTIRSREVSVRKVFGAGRPQLIRQFIGESLLLSLLAYLIAMLVVEFTLPQFNQFTGKEVSVNYSDASFTIGMLIILVFTGIFSGAYPSLYLSSYIPVKILQGDVKAGPVTFRRILVILQFSAALVMIICAGIVFRQLGYIQSRNLGLDTDQVIYCNVKGSMSEKYHAFRQELLKYPGIKGVANSSSLPTWNDQGTYWMGWDGKNEEDEIFMDINKVDYGFVSTFGIEMAEGRNFSMDRPADSTCFILNESAIRVMQMEDPIGKRFMLWGVEGQIIGVMKDFNFKSLHKEIEPLCLFMTNPYHNEIYGYIYIKLDGNDIRKTLNVIESTWKDINPYYPLDYTFLDEKYDALYISESRMRSLFTIFAILSIFLSCLGLYGLSAFMAEKRIREIGIRKALGARPWQIMTVFSWDALKWILISNLIAWPIAWLYMKHWLNDFAYKTKVSPMIFILSSLVVLAIALAALSFQALKVSRSNPAVSIKHE
jgi:ABC-type antimicrobial peptide transport system permease subunit